MVIKKTTLAMGMMLAWATTGWAVDFVPASGVERPVRTYELGSCIQQLVWMHDLDLNAQLGDLDAAAAAGVNWVRLTMVYKRSLDNHLIEIIKHCNELGINVLMEFSSFNSNLYPPGTEPRAGNREAGGWSYDSYRLSDLDLGLAEQYLRDFFTFVQTNGASFAALEIFNEMNWSSFNGDLPLPLEGWVINESTPWDDPDFVKYREGVLKTAQLAKVVDDLSDEFFGGSIQVVTSGQVGLSTFPPAALTQGGAGGSIASDVLTLKLMQGTYLQPVSTALYEDDFSGSSPSNLLGTTTDVGGGVWTSAGASAAFKADGSVGTNTAASGIWLPVSVEAGTVYTLSAEITQPVVSSKWISLGYAQTNTDGVFYGANGYGTIFVAGWGGGQANGRAGLNLDGSIGATGGGDNGKQLDIVLDASDSDSANWTMQFYVGGVELGTGPYTTTNGDYGTIGYIGFSTSAGTVTGTIDNFKLTTTEFIKISTTNYLDYIDGIGTHIYPQTFDIDPQTAEDTAYAHITNALNPMLVVPGAGTTKPFWITEFGYKKAQSGNNETTRLAQHEIFFDALTRYDRPKSAVGAVMHYVWNDIDPAASVWTGGQLLKTGEIFLSPAAENTNWATRLYEAWQVECFGDQSHLETVAGSTIDFDNDGVPNLDEYALGGDPTDDQDTGYSPQGSMQASGTWFNFVYPQRAGGTNSGIRYEIEWSDNLVSNGWNATGFEGVGTNINGVAAGLDAVTIRLSTEDKGQQFIRLTVEEL